MTIAAALLAPFAVAFIWFTWLFAVGILRRRKARAKSREVITERMAADFAEAMRRKAARHVRQGMRPDEPIDFKAAGRGHYRTHRFTSDAEIDACADIRPADRPTVKVALAERIARGWDHVQVTVSEPLAAGTCEHGYDSGCPWCRFHNKPTL